jgi:hypothetical protein
MLLGFAALGDRMSVAPQGETYAKGASRLPLVFYATVHGQGASFGHNATGRG